MQPLTSKVLDRWPLVALASSALMLAIAHAFETFGHLAPCYLCLKQREVYWVAMAIAAAAWIVIRLKNDRRLKVAADLLLAVAFAVGCGIAVYHAGAEWKFWPGPTVCAPAVGPVQAGDLAALLSGKKMDAPSCEDAAWVFLGISMAGWNALISLKLTILSLMAARREARA